VWPTSVDIGRRAPGHSPSRRYAGVETTTDEVHTLVRIISARVAGPPNDESIEMMSAAAHALIALDVRSAFPGADAVNRALRGAA
jgi:hypothetical protein